MRKRREFQGTFENLEKSLPEEIKKHLKSKEIYHSLREDLSEINEGSKEVLSIVRNPYIINSIEESGYYITVNLLDNDKIVLSNLIAVDKDFTELYASIVSSYLTEELLNNKNKLENFTFHVNRELFEMLRLSNYYDFKKTLLNDVVFYLTYYYVIPEQVKIMNFPEFFKKNLIISTFPEYFPELYKNVKNAKEKYLQFMKKSKDPYLNYKVDFLARYKDLLTLMEYKPLFTTLEIFKDERNIIKLNRLRILLEEFYDIFKRVPVKDIEKIPDYPILKKYIKNLDLNKNLSLYKNFKR